MNKPTLILIGGGTAAGKSSIAEFISKEIKKNLSNNPKSIHDAKLKNILISLLKRERIVYPRLEKVVKNSVNTELIFHENGETKDPADIIIVEGVHALQFESINKLADLKIYVSADDDIRLMRKLKRISKGIRQNLNHEERLNFLFDLMDRWIWLARADHIKFILPTKKSADLIIDNNPENIANNSKLKQIIHHCNNKEKFEVMKNQEKRRDQK
ncbi:5487_t:CDS:2, partial [Funneliformis caledonium]